MTNQERQPAGLDLAALRARLAAAGGQQYWRGLEEIAATEEFQAFLQREFPQQAAEGHDPISRRRFLQVMAASLALAGLSSCAPAPAERIMPYVRAPEEVVPGQPLYYATAMSLSGSALGILAKSHMGRPIKVEGNPQHPASLGGTHAFAQGSILTLYDPDRSQAVTYAGRISSWGTFLGAITRAMGEQRRQGGKGLRILTETVISPTMAYQLRQLLDRFPAAKWHQYEPVNQSNAWEGARLAFGDYVDTQYRFDAAAVILALDADFLACEPGHVRYAHDFIGKRRVWQGQTAMSRLYAVESTHTNTGAMADHRLALRPSDIPVFARILAQQLGIDTGPQGEGQARGAPLLDAHARWVRAVVDDLRAHQGASIIIAGLQQPPAVHVLAHAMNHALGNVGRTLFYTDPVAAQPLDQMASLRALTADMEAGAVDLLVILGANPVYTAPADLRFAEHLAKVRLRVHLGLYQDETAVQCHWHIPETHFLEAWGDVRAPDGTVTIIQPLILPLYGGRSAYELLAVLAGELNPSGYQIVRDYWRRFLPAESFEPFWRRALHDGAMAETAHAPRPVAFRGARVADQQGRAAPPSTLELVFRPDPTMWDGRFANNGWLQELPKPLTKLTWDNAALLSPATAERLGLSNEEVVELRYQGRAVQAPVWIMPGHADDAVTITLGYGRWRAGRVGTGTGFNAYALRTSEAPWTAVGVEVHKTGARHLLASTQHHHSMEGRHPVRVGTLSESLAHPAAVHGGDHDAQPLPSLYPQYPYPGYAWGMAIDLNACIGCNACVIACQAENNIPVVGKGEVARGREMHWLRIDRYYRGALDAPETYFQPIPCMHCENAPCELVCPVAATVHSAEGLNDMVYNRCVGTRYCSNNCPYKVRRFNFFQYADYEAQSLKLLHNPDVTVRSRGVMEKCTYCVQRINAARIQAEKEQRALADGEVVTACQQACPTGAIIFGNINDAASQVAKMKATPLNYGLLAELNTQPRTTYLARLRNPNPALEA
jgi:molybdopterin-containing oxidoreductase family iron-sulfur binding subunit